MTDKTIWLIYLRAAIGEASAQRLDGSTQTCCIAAVPEKDLEQALKLLHEDLGADDMTLLEVYRCQRTDVEQMPGEASLKEHLDYICRTATARGVIAMATVGDEAF